MAEVNIDVNVVAKQAVAILKGMEKQTKKNTSSFAGLGKSIIVMNQGLALAGKAFRFVKNNISTVIDAAKVQEDAINALNISLKASGTYSEEASQSFQDYASSLQLVTKFGDEAILQNAALIQSLGQLDEEALKGATKSALDMAAALGISLTSAATLVGKAASGEVGSFSRYGLAIKKGADNAETFANALDAINSKFGGAAAGQVKTFSGATQQLSNAFGDVLEEIGFIITKNPEFVTAINKMTTGFSKIGGFVKNNADFLRGLITDASIGALKIGIKIIFGVVQAVNGLRTAWTLYSTFMEKSVWRVISSINLLQEGYVRAKMAVKSMVGASTETEQAQLKEIEARESNVQSLIELADKEAEESTNKIARQQTETEELQTILEEGLEVQLQTKTAHVEKVADIELTDADRKKAAEKKAKLALDKWNSYQLNSSQKLEQKKGAIVASGFAAMAAVAKEGGKKSFLLWQAASGAEAIVSGYLAVSKALASSPPPWNFVAAAAVGVQSALAVKGIATAKPPAFENGGMVGGTSYTGDKVNILANSGELILNRAQQDNVADQMTGGNIIFNITGDVVSEDSFIDKVVDGINNAVEFRNLKLRSNAA